MNGSYRTHTLGGYAQGNGHLLIKETRLMINGGFSYMITCFLHEFGGIDGCFIASTLVYRAVVEIGVGGGTFGGTFRTPPPFPIVDSRPAYCSSWSHCI